MQNGCRAANASESLRWPTVGSIVPRNQASGRCVDQVGQLTKVVSDLRRRIQSLIAIVAAAMMLNVAPSPVSAPEGEVSGKTDCSREMWIDLSEPAASVDLDSAEAAHRQERVAAQQDEIAGRLRAAGIEELARVRHVRNAILVRISPSQAETVSRWPGVVGLRPADRLHPPVIDDAPRSPETR